MVKRLFAISLALCMLVSLGITAVAEENMVILAKEEPQKHVSYVPMPEGSEELLKNRSFEEKDENGNPLHWEAYNGGFKVDNEYISVVNEDSFDGNTHISIQGKNNPWVRQLIYRPFKKGEVYQLSVWTRIPESGKTGFKLEWHDKEDAYMGGNNSESQDKATGDKWVQWVYHMTVPKDCYRITFYTRNFKASGKVDIDNASFYKIKDPAAVFIDTDEIFYYTEDAEKGYFGHATGTLNLESYPEIEGAFVTFRIKDGDKVVKEEKNVPTVDNVAKFHFPISVMTEEWREYTFEAVAVAADGAELAKNSRPIYKYPRPTYLNEEGNVVLPDGTVEHQSLWYHVNVEDYESLASVGGTVVQSIFEDYEGIKKCLDEAEKYDIKVMMRLYCNMKPAAHPENIENTTEVISKLKDHPALMGYMVMDEPGSYFADKPEYFENSYKLIRSLDPHHPVYLVEAQLDKYEQFQKYVDIFAIDPYPDLESYKEVHPLSYVYFRTTAAAEQTEFRKPIWTINQASVFREWHPDNGDIRNMFYQTLFAGASTVGYYSFSDNIHTLDASKVEKRQYYHTDRYDDMKSFYDTTEDEEAYAHFIHRQYPIFTEYTTEQYDIKTQTHIPGSYHVSSYVKDGAVYMYVIAAEEEAKCSIPLQSDGGAVSIDGFKAEIIYGGTGAIEGSGTLEFTLPRHGAYLFKITPTEAVDFSALKVSKYRDLYMVPWAAEAIRNLESQGIVNDYSPTGFAPSKNITRGELAYFLVRTLGLTAETTDTFADVEPTAVYAKELAVGRALGILKGVGDNKYNPEAEISRQDLMTIIARGMQLSGTGADLSAFSDAGQIADYARDAVGAMVLSGLVKGNADGTMNPLGNTTRAEAAVIMQRILEK